MVAANDKNVEIARDQLIIYGLKYNSLNLKRILGVRLDDYSMLSCVDSYWFDYNLLDSYSAMI